MATSSISNAIGAANSKMAEAIRKQEEREAAAKMRGGRDTSAREELAERNRKRSKSSQRKPPKALSNRWSMPADFSLPSPLTNRPTGDAGGVSFHFSVRRISKESSPTIKGEPMAGYKNANAPGSDHELYITRDGAAEGIAAAHEAYILRTDAPEVSRDSLATSSDGEVKHDDIDEKIEGGAGGQTLSIFSNISDSEQESIDFWRAVHRKERSAKVHTIVIDAREDPIGLMTAAKGGRFDPEMSAAMQLAVDDLEAFKSGKTATYKPRSITVSSDRAGEILQTAARESRSPSFNRAIKFKSGKGGTVQHRFVVELPHELNAAERAGLARRFAQHLGNLSVDEDGNPIGMMYTAVVHAPDAHNDKRNYHLHIIAHDRPAKFNDTYKMWDFEIPAIRLHRGEVRVTYPFRQNKIAMVRQSSTKTGRSDGGVDFSDTDRLVS